jgi:CMP-N,N'-diacetyllegionaminic acid synthase
MSQVIALIPARSGSKGISGKNLRLLGGKPLVQHAWECAVAAGCDWVEVSTDYTPGELWDAGVRVDGFTSSQRPPHLCGDDVPMLDVIQHWLGTFHGTLFNDPETVMVLVQPTQPLRTPEHIREAVKLLRETQADSVVSVVELPRTHSPEFALRIYSGRLGPSDDWEFADLPTRRQDVEPTYIRDGTVYAFWVKTLRSGTIYGDDVRSLIIPAEQTCELDTMADWEALERRWRARHA